MVFGLFRAHHYPRVGFIYLVLGGGWGPPSPLLDPYSTPPLFHPSIPKTPQHFSLYIQRYLHSYTSNIFLSVFFAPTSVWRVFKKMEYSLS